MKAHFDLFKADDVDEILLRTIRQHILDHDELGYSAKETNVCIWQTLAHRIISESTGDDWLATRLINASAEMLDPPPELQRGLKPIPAEELPF